MNEESDEQIRARCADLAKGPGKFEGEPAWLVYLVEQCLETGCSEDYFDDDTTTITLVVPDDNDRRIFPELNAVPRVAWWESEQGFVYKRVLSQDEWCAWRDEATSADE